VADNLYCSRRDVLNAPGGRDITARSDDVESSIASTNVLTLNAHGLETDDEVTLRAVAGGTLSAPLVAGTVYYAIRLTSSTFSLAATAGGAAINLTTDGETMIVSHAEPEFDSEIEATSRWIDRFLPAHIVPLGVDEAVPADIKRICADTTARRMLVISGKSSASVKEIEMEGKAQLERFVTGITLRGVATPAAANLAISGAVVGTVADTRGWSPVGGGIP
jgi:hypothetical protein